MKFEPLAGAGLFTRPFLSGPFARSSPHALVTGQPCIITRLCQMTPTSSQNECVRAYHQQLAYDAYCEYVAVALQPYP